MAARLDARRVHTNPVPPLWSRSLQPGREASSPLTEDREKERNIFPLHVGVYDLDKRDRRSHGAAAPQIGAKRKDCTSPHPWGNG